MKPRFSDRVTRAWFALAAPIAALALLCGGVPGAAHATEKPTIGARKDKHGQLFPPAPAAAQGALSPTLTNALAEAGAALRERRFPSAAVKTIGASGDARMGWALYDLLRFAGAAGVDEVVSAFEQLSGSPLPAQPFTAMGDRLLAWDLPAPPGYREFKRDLFLLIEPKWEPFFADANSAIDWRRVGWGGVFIDDRPDATQGQTCPRGCIPALDQPKTTPAAQGRWYPDSAIVFGVVINGQARAYPKNIMEVHEMVNDTLGGRRIGMPYCTLCRSAQAFFTDRAPGFEPLLRTSGLLSRSN